MQPRPNADFSTFDRAWGGKDKMIKGTVSVDVLDAMRRTSRAHGGYSGCIDLELLRLSQLEAHFPSPRHRDTHTLPWIPLRRQQSKNNRLSVLNPVTSAVSFPLFHRSVHITVMASAPATMYGPWAGMNAPAPTAAPEPPAWLGMRNLALRQDETEIITETCAYYSYTGSFPP